MAAPTAQAPPALLLVLDSVRADRLGLYGHDRDTAPNLQRLAERATVYEDAVAPAAWTLPSHGSLFTGLYPSAHGATNGFIEADDPPQLPAEPLPLAARLADAGYRTAGFSGNPWVGGLTGLDRGFDEFVEWNLKIGAEGTPAIHTPLERLYSKCHWLLGHASRQPLFLLKRRFFTASLVDRAVRWLDAVATDGGGAHSFTFLNLMEAHSPYFPPRRAFRELGLPAPGPIEPRVLNTRLLAYVMGRTDLDASLRRRVLEYYDASLRYQDREVGRLLERFESTVPFEDALVVVCADHGKTLGEYDRDAALPHYLRDVNLSVPLLIKYPGQTAGRTVESVVELRRLYDVFRDGGARPIEAYGDRDGDDQHHALVEEFIPHTGRERASVTRWRALVGPEHKYVESDAGETYLLDRTGPVDRERVIDDPGLARTLADRLETRVGQLTPAQPVRSAGNDARLGSDVEAQLEDLGYL